jgi:hypothetical protein
VESGKWKVGEPRKYTEITDGFLRGRSPATLAAGYRCADGGSRANNEIAGRFVGR